MCCMVVNFDVTIYPTDHNEIPLQGLEHLHAQYQIINRSTCYKVVNDVLKQSVFHILVKYELYFLVYKQAVLLAL